MLKEEGSTWNEHQSLLISTAWIVPFRSAYGDRRTDGKTIKFALLSLTELLFRIS